MTLTDWIHFYPSKLWILSPVFIAKMSQFHTLWERRKARKKAWSQQHLVNLAIKFQISHFSFSLAKRSTKLKFKLGIHCASHISIFCSFFGFLAAALHFFRNLQAQKRKEKLSVFRTVFDGNEQSNTKTNERRKKND